MALLQLYRELGLISDRGEAPMHQDPFYSLENLQRLHFVNAVNIGHRHCKVSNVRKKIAQNHSAKCG